MIRRIPRALLTDEPALSLGAVALQGWLDASRAAQPAHGDELARLRRALEALFDAELALKPEHIHAIVERALLTVRRAATIELRVHPEDLALLAEARSYRAHLDLTGELVVVADDAVERGGCMVTSNLGELDARRTTRIDAAAELMLRGAFDAR